MSRRRKKNQSGCSGCLIAIAIFFAIGIIGGIVMALVEAAASVWPFLLVIGLIVVGLFIGYKIYVNAYFKSEKFLSLKNSIAAYIADCNELDNHIEELKQSYINYHKIDYGEARYQNVGKYNYKREMIANADYSPYIYDCSRSVCENARRQPFKYLCKYFNIETNEEALEEFESILNNFLAAEDGKTALKAKKQAILDQISDEIPSIIKNKNKERLDKELGFEEYKFKEVYFPKFTFRYISEGGNSGLSYDLVLNIEMLERFINYLADIIKFNKSVKGQRKLMTPKLRSQILERDAFTCRICGNSTNNEPNLLLEVDHIIPLAKGGITSEDNLQTLCWKCNRRKGSKLLTVES